MQDYLDAEEQGQFMYPAISMNNVTYRGSLDGKYVMKAVCEKYQKLPKSCVKLLSPRPFFDETVEKYIYA